jgi:hypothetical protein
MVQRTFSICTLQWLTSGFISIITHFICVINCYYYS